MTAASQPLALLSVSDKTNIETLAQALIEAGYKIVSTGGTAQLIESLGLEVMKISALTEFPEILDGRVKTLHPMVHGALLADRDNPTHIEQVNSLGIPLIKVVAVNLYPFSDQAVKKSLPLEEAIEFVDIGGPTMIRASAKNYKNISIITDPNDYPEFVEKIMTGSLNQEYRQYLATKAFRHTANYDAVIADYFAKTDAPDIQSPLPTQLNIEANKQADLRYGENPHQAAAFYSTNLPKTANMSVVYEGKPLSYNNYIDIDAAWRICSEFTPAPTLTIIKHTNPCCLATNADSAAQLFDSAIAGDSKSAFGGIIGCNIVIDAACAEKINKGFFECIVASEFTEEAIAIFKTKKNLRLIKMESIPPSSNLTVSIQNLSMGALVQSKDSQFSTPSAWTFPTELQPDAAMTKDLEFAFKAVKHVKSNAITLCKSGICLGVGAGQMSRIDALELAIKKATDQGSDLKGAVMGSDAFFPFADCVELAAKARIAGIIQPGGSIRDQESIDAANQAGLVMAFTGMRHFLH